MLLGMLLLSACGHVQRFQRGALVAHGERLDGAEQPLFYSIGIDLQQAPDARMLDARVKLSDRAP
ncbi:hypothetical protein [Marinobacterium aestuariivivens]|uniref:Uncharacterized protein n=1 Tax=Marinobacterium aestuariivivens TaxID=1698799 RepID=A0ABW1ZW81_9GAMM